MLALVAGNELCDTAGVSADLLTFVGRHAELGELQRGLEQTRAGCGGVWLVAGEPGIGKTRLIEEVARAAVDSGIQVHWGRCWEAGGAPAYWPWIQVLRSVIGAGEPTPTRAAQLGQLLPELRDRSDGDAAPPLSPEKARFELLDAIAATLMDAARTCPLIVVLEDLHAADSSSVLLLDFLAHQARNARVMIVGTLREAEAHRSDSGALLLRVARQARKLALPRLDASDVRSFLSGALGQELEDELAALVVTRTEGLPLFLVELSRLLTTHPGAGQHNAETIPPTVRMAIRERLEQVAPSTTDLLRLAAIFGREIEPARIAAAFGCEPKEVDDALRDAEQAHLVVAGGRGGWRFAHILIREVALAGLSPQRASELHLAAASALRDDGATWAEIAHHYLAAGPAGRLEAVEAAARAGREATAQLAFDDAATAFRSALDALGSDDPIARGRLLMSLGRALLQAGSACEGREACLQAIELGRRGSSPEVLAEAVLELGSIMHFVQVDRQLVELLVEAKDALSRDASPLRARVLARLAAAMQPAPDPREPIERAREAIAMARSGDDRAALLEVLRSGGSAFVDLLPPGERIDIDCEYVELARELGAHADLHRAATRLVPVCFELGRMADAESAIAEVTSVANRLEHATYRWRAVAFEATRRLWQGELDQAEELIAKAAALGAEAGDPNAVPASTYQRMSLYRLAGRQEELAALIPAVRDLYRGTPAAEPVGELLSAALLLELGRTEEGVARARAKLEATPLTTTDHTLLPTLALIAKESEDRDLARAVIDKIEHSGAQFLSSGVVGMTWEEPSHRALARAWETLGEPQRALDHLARGLDSARAAGGLAITAHMLCEYAELALRAGVGDRARARACATESRELATTLGMSQLAAKATELLAQLEGDEPLATAGPAAPRAPAPAPTAVLRRDGDTWTAELGTRSVRLKHSKGLSFLARLVERPGQEVHVLDLIGDTTGEAGIDLGDSGELLDAEARASYKRRIAELQSEIDDADACADLGRAEAARTELDFLTTELTRAVGLGGRSRRAGQAAERARVNVQRRIRDTLRRIAQHDSTIARHFERSIRTGRFCSYEPL